MAIGISEKALAAHRESVEKRKARLRRSSSRLKDYRPEKALSTGNFYTTYRNTLRKQQEPGKHSSMCRLAITNAILSRQRRYWIDNPPHCIVDKNFNIIPTPFPVLPVFASTSSAEFVPTPETSIDPSSRTAKREQRTKEKYCDVKDFKRPCVESGSFIARTLPPQRAEDGYDSDVCDPITMLGMKRRKLLRARMKKYEAKRIAMAQLDEQCEIAVEAHDEGKNEEDKGKKSKKHRCKTCRKRHDNECPYDFSISFKPRMRHFNPADYKQPELPIFDNAPGAKPQRLFLRWQQTQLKKMGLPAPVPRFTVTEPLMQQMIASKSSEQHSRKSNSPTRALDGLPTGGGAESNQLDFCAETSAFTPYCKPEEDVGDLIRRLYYACMEYDPNNDPYGYMCYLAKEKAFLPVFLLKKEITQAIGSCEPCRMLFYEEGEAAAHWKLHGKKGPYQCAFCGENYVHRETFRLHIESEPHPWWKLDDLAALNPPSTADTRITHMQFYEGAWALSVE